MDLKKNNNKLKMRGEFFLILTNLTPTVCINYNFIPHKLSPLLATCSLSYIQLATFSLPV